MSAYVNPKYATPDVGNPSPWQKALATTMQDTGANQWPTMPPYQGGGTGGPTVFDAPPGYQPPGGPPGGTFGASASGSSPFGYTYSNPGAGFNPWGTYQGGDSYSGSDGAGLYNASADTKKGWGPNGQGEFDRDRVWRMTLGDLKAKGLDPGSADPAVVQAAYLNNIARLHRDYDQTYGPQAWAGSAFAGYDKLAGGQGATQQGGARGVGGQVPGAQIDPNTRLPGSSLPNGGMMYDQGSGTSTQGGSTVDPMAGRGSTPPQASGTNAIPGTSAPGGGVPTPGNPGASSYPNFGQLGNVDPAMAYQAMQQDPGVAAHYLRLAAGQSGPVTGRLGQFRDSLYGRALQAYLALGGVGGNKSGFGGAQDFLSAMNGGDLQGLLNGAAGNAAGANFTGQDDATTEKILRAAIALKSLGTGTLGSSLMSGDLNNLLYSQEGQEIQGNGIGAASSNGGLGRLAQGGSPYGQALQQFLALR